MATIVLLPEHSQNQHPCLHYKRAIGHKPLYHRSGSQGATLSLVKEVATPLFTPETPSATTYMNNHMHSAPQAKKEESREERKKNHTL